jgi:hypothetical protein
MSAFYFHGDMHDVATLRIRTPKFETHEEASEHYYMKLLERQAARERRRLFYSGLVLIAVGISLYKLYLTVNPQTMGQFILSFVSGLLSAALALAFCTKAFAWLWDAAEEEDPVDEKESSEEEDSAV